MTNAIPTPPSPESLEKTLEEMRRFGENFRAILDHVTDQQGPIKPPQEPVDPLINRYADSAAKFTNNQTAAIKGWALEHEGALPDGVQLLKQSFDGEKADLIDSQKDTVRTEITPDTYIPRVYVPVTLLTQLMPGSGAVAVRAKKGEGIQFVLLMDENTNASSTDDVESARRSERYAEYKAENVTHEGHHLIWDNVMKTDVFPDTERDSEWSKSFQAYRDELMARCVSEGSLTGYRHMNAQPHGEIDAKVLELNDILGTITPLLTHSDKVRRIDLVKPVMESRNFEEMKTALSTTKTLIENLGLRPIPPQENNGDGWTTAR